MSHSWLVSLALLIGCSADSGPKRVTPFMLLPEPPTLDLEYEPHGPRSPRTGEESVPVYGGTLAATDDLVVAAQPDLDQLVAFDRLENGAQPTTRRAPVDPRWVVLLEAGTEPFRVSVDSDQGVAYVTLRGAGEILAVDVATGGELGRATVCPEPRGVAVTGDEVLVACASGELVWLEHDLRPLRAARITPDLRDVVVSQGEVWVSRFRRADVGRVDVSDGSVQWFRPDVVPQSSGRTGEAHGAWRMRAMPEGGVLWVHQAAYDGVVGELFEGVPLQVPYYGSRDRCAANLVVTTHVSIVDTNDEVRTSGHVAGTPLPVDVDTDGEQVVIAVAGARPGVATIVGTTVENLRSQSCVMGAAKRRGPTSVEPTVTSVVLHGGANPGLLYLETNPGRLSLGSWSGHPPKREEHDSRDASFGRFHRDVGAQVTCASCHPEGQDDGHVWTFAGVGARRTQNIAGGVTKRAPFHWRGELDTMNDLMGEVFSFRMQGDLLASWQVESLGRWLDDIAPVETSSPDTELVARGAELFYDPVVNCASCHGGSDFSDHLHHVVRSGEPSMKTPSLIGVGSRAPYMSDGCGDFLEERFTSLGCGGGDQHGVTSHLTPDDVRALVAFLQTL